MSVFDKSFFTEKLKALTEAYYLLPPDSADDAQIYNVSAMLLRGILAEKERRANAAHIARGDKEVYYLSMEFLLGRSLKNSLYDLGLTDAYEKALAGFGVSPERIYAREPDAGLGNGGLGRLAACFMDGLATVGKQAMGYSICFEYGIFRQILTDGWQSEKPDDWLPGGGVWLEAQNEKSVDVRFGGDVREFWDGGGHFVEYKNDETVRAVPYDVMLPGFDTPEVSRLRLWKATTPEVDMDLFNAGNYPDAFRQASMAKAISSILYPNDSHAEGKFLRLKQQYFLVCASLSDIVRRHIVNYGTLETLPEKAAVHINDTHPALAVPELLRRLLDDCGYGWEKSWDIAFRTFSYTNHTVMPEALERWDAGALKALLPRIYMIILEIDRRLCRDLEAKGFREEEIERMAILSGGQIRMANLCVWGCHKVNGVSEHHLAVMRESAFRDLGRAFPERFTSVTNGIAARRWLCVANPRLAALAKELCGDFEHDPERLRLLREYENDPAALESLGTVKRLNKGDFAKQFRDVCGDALDPDSIFDVQAKRLHEYKRQHLNALRMLALLGRLEADPGADILPRTFLFGAKAAPGYHLAKRIIKLIWMIGTEMRRSPAARDRFHLVYLENYSVTASELLMPAAELSEQISLAGTEASGTGNMKLALSGAVTVGTPDGANLEIFREAGAENNFPFGMTSDEAAALRGRGYDPRVFIEADPELRYAIGRLRTGVGGEDFSDLAELLETADFYMACADFRAYMDAEDEADRRYRDRNAWNRMSLANIAASPEFFVDRTVREYCEKIWNA